MKVGHSDGLIGDGRFTDDERDKWLGIAKQVILEKLQTGGITHVY